MYMRIVRGSFDPSVAAAIDALTGEVGDALGRLPGHDHTHIGMDRVGGRAVTVTTWDTEAHARFSRDLLGTIVGKLQAAGMTLQPAEVYEVVGG